MLKEVFHIRIEYPSGERSTYSIFEVRNIRNMDTELKIVVGDVQRQATAISKGRTF